MIQIKRKGQELVFNTENTVILKDPHSSHLATVPVPTMPKNTSDIPFSMWREERRRPLEEIKGHFTRILNQLPTDYVYHVNRKKLEHDIEKLIYRTSANKSKQFPRPSDLVS